jgi:hypothetical protein
MGTAWDMRGVGSVLVRLAIGMTRTGTKLMGLRVWRAGKEADFA